MGIFLNRGIEEFEGAVNSPIYVDKTGMITEFNKLVETEQRYACISRPRRFGKTMAANMLAAYFEKGSDSRHLFENRKLGQTTDWDRNLNKYDVIRIDMADMISSSDSPEAALDFIEKNVVKDVLTVYELSDISACTSVGNTLDQVNQAYGAKFIIIIDEWDAFFRDDRSNGRLQDRYINLLRSLFKGNRSKKFTVLAYITGILPIKKYNSESALNNFREYTMLSPKKLDRFVGFTEDEVRDLCDKYDMDYKEVSGWYDGYNVGKIGHIFGPNSVVQAMLDGECMNYWSQTVAFSSLGSYITMNFDGLRDAIVTMLGGVPVFVDTTGYENDMVSFKTKDDVLTLLIHLGYLCFNAQDETAYIPNKEVRQIFERSMKPSGWMEVAEALEASEKLLKNLLKGNGEAVAEGVEKCHRENTSIIKYNDENSLAATLGLAFYHARVRYRIVREMPAGEGFADLVFIPREGEDVPAIVMELKYEDSPESAIRQIKEKKYPECLEGIKGEILLVGISYDKGDKKHSCLIEKACLD